MRRKLLAVMTCVAVLGVAYSGGVFAQPDASSEDISSQPGKIACPDKIKPGETPTPILTPVPTDTPTEEPTPTPYDTPTLGDPCY